jgi:hypothetical protein
MGWRLAGRLGAGRQAALDAHLAGCDACAGRLRAQAAVDAALANVEVAPAPPDLKARVLALVAEEAPVPPGRAHTRPSWWLLSGLVAAFLLPAWLIGVFLSGSALAGSSLRALGRADAAGAPSRLPEVAGTLASATLTVERWLALGFARGAFVAGLVVLVAGVLVWATLLRRWSGGAGERRRA